MTGNEITCQDGGESRPDLRRSRPDVRPDDGKQIGESRQTEATRPTHATTTENDLAVLSVSFKKPTLNKKQEKEVLWPRFLLLRRTEKDFNKVTLFLISKSLFGLVGDVKNVKKVKGTLLVETVSKVQSNRLLQINRLANMEVEVTPRPTLNRHKSTMYCPDLLNRTLEEIKEELAHEHVVEGSGQRKMVFGSTRLYTSLRYVVL